VFVWGGLGARSWAFLVTVMTIACITGAFSSLHHHLQTSFGISPVHFRFLHLALRVALHVRRIFSAYHVWWHHIMYYYPAALAKLTTYTIVYHYVMPGLSWDRLSLRQVVFPRDRLKSYDRRFGLPFQPLTRSLLRFVIG
jgi:hypothetical protein